MKNFIAIIFFLSTNLAFSQCDQYFKKYESAISKTSYYIGEEIRLVNAGEIGGSMDLYTQEDRVYFQIIVLVDKETCWNEESSTVTLRLQSGEEVVLPFGEATYNCQDGSVNGSFLVSKESMQSLVQSAATEISVQFDGYQSKVAIPTEVIDDFMDSNIKAYPRRQLMESIACLMEAGY